MCSISFIYNSHKYNIMFLTQLFEALDKRHAAFCFGRMNPPTQGHQQLINTVARSAAGGDYFIFTSQSQDAKKNPLDYATKVKFLKALFPDHASHIVQDPSLKTIMQVAHWLYTKGYRKVTFVAGSDRLADFKELLEKYNGMETANGYYQFDSINFASSGDRDPDSDGLAGISATAAREAAKAGNYEAFAQAVGAGKLTKQLYDAVRQGMGLDYTVNESQADFSRYSTNDLQNMLKTIKRDNHGVTVITAITNELLRRRQVSECSGYIPKNKREAKDPRWSNALSVDVTPKTPRKNAKALRLV